MAKRIWSRLKCAQNQCYFIKLFRSTCSKAKRIWSRLKYALNQCYFINSVHVWSRRTRAIIAILHILLYRIRIFRAHWQCACCYTFEYTRWPNHSGQTIGIEGHLYMSSNTPTPNNLNKRQKHLTCANFGKPLKFYTYATAWRSCNMTWKYKPHIYLQSAPTVNWEMFGKTSSSSWHACNFPSDPRALPYSHRPTPN